MYSMHSCQHYAAGCQDYAALCSRLPADLSTVRLRHPLVTLACQVLLCKSSCFKKVNFSCVFEESSLEVCKRQATKSQLTVGFVPENGGSRRRRREEEAATFVWTRSQSGRTEQHYWINSTLYFYQSNVVVIYTHDHKELKLKTSEAGYHSSEDILWTTKGQCYGSSFNPAWYAVQCSLQYTILHKVVWLL